MGVRVSSVVEGAPVFRISALLRAHSLLALRLYFITGSINSRTVGLGFGPKKNFTARPRVGDEVLALRLVLKSEPKGPK